VLLRGACISSRTSSRRTGAALGPEVAAGEGEASERLGVVVATAATCEAHETRLALHVRFSLSDVFTPYMAAGCWSMLVWLPDRAEARWQRPVQEFVHVAVGLALVASILFNLYL
jgi:hypothetical protein